MCEKFLFPDIFQVFGYIIFTEQKKMTYSGLELNEVTGYIWKQKVLIDGGSGPAGVEQGLGEKNGKRGSIKTK